MHFKSLIIAGIFGVAVSALPANAETILTGFGGASFGGDADETHSTWGGGIGFAGRVLGFEAMLDYSPNFFADRPFAPDKSNLTTLMGNLMLIAPINRSRLYASGGAGLMRSRLDDAGDLFENITENDLGINVGAGVIGYFSENVGLRADLRYFRNLTADEPQKDLDLDLGNFDYWRAAGGLTIRF